MPTKYYPSLSSVVTLDDFPEYLGFIKEGIQSIFDKIYIKDFQAHISPRGESGFYGLSIVSKSPLKFQIPGTELAFILNPDNTDPSISSFPVTVEYQWLVLAYLRNFDLNNFSFSARDFYELGLDVLNVSEEQVLQLIINKFVIPANPSLSSIEQFVNDLNSKLDLNIPVPTSDNKLKELVLSIKEQSVDEASIVSFLVYLVDETDLQASLNNVKSFFKALVPEDIDSYVKNIITPRARVTLALTAAIEFPKSILKPVQPNGADLADTNQKTQFKFAQALLYADTQQGFGYQMELGGSLFPRYAGIGKTGMIIEIQSLKLDLSKTSNIAEADADGRPADFVGVYARAISVTLPPKWFHDVPTTSTQTTFRIGGYDLLVGTGGISGTFMLESIPVITPGNPTYYFEDKFDIDFPITLFQKNPTSGEIEDTFVDNIGELKDLLFFQPGNNEIPPYSIRFPLSLVEHASIGGQSRTFATNAQYQSYLTSLLSDKTLWKKLGGPNGFSIGLNKFDITFKQNVIVESNIEAKLIIPKLKDSTGEAAKIDVKGHLQQDGDFNLTASEPQGIPLNLFNVLNITLQSVELGRENDVFYIGADTKISFPPGSFIADVFQNKEVDLPAMRFYANGRFEITGGTTFIPTNFTLGIGPIEMSVTGIHLGNIQREKDGIMRTYNYIGFDGGMSIDPIGLDIRGSGVKYYYTVDCDEVCKKYNADHNTSYDAEHFKDSYLFISTLEVDLIIPGTAKPAEAVAIIKGSITIPEPGVSTEYSGKVTMQLPKAKIYGEARLRLNPKYPSFLVEAEVQPPAPIPLGPIGINSFRGLLGLRYVAEKRAIGMDESRSWYDYYMAPEKGIHTEKFSGPELTKDYDNPFSVGVGATFSSMEGGGRIASLRAMVLLSVPSLFAIDAGLTLLSERLGLAEDDPTSPPFYAFVIVTDDSLEFGASAKFRLNKSKGYFLDISAQVEAGFFFKNQKPWYVNFGTPTKPVTAKIFKEVLNVNSQAYLMLSAGGITAGARADFKFKFVIAKFTASVEVGGYISFEKPQIGAYVLLKGMIKIKFGPFKLNIIISVALAVEMPKPFLIYARFTIKVCARIGWFKVCVPAKFTLKWKKNNQLQIKPIPPLTYLPSPASEKDYPKVVQTANFVKGVNMLTYEEFELHCFGINNGIAAESTFYLLEPNPDEIDCIIPLDTYIDIKLEKGLNPMPLNGKIGGHTGGAQNYVDLLPPKRQVKGKTLRQVKHKYSIESLEIFAWRDRIKNGLGQVIHGAWVPYHPFKALLPDRPVDNLKIGFWQRNGKQYDTLRILATNPFSFLDGAEPGWFIPEQYGITPSELFCTSNAEIWNSADVLAIPLNTIYTPNIDPDAFYYIDGAYFKIGYEGDMTVQNVANPFNFERSLIFANSETLIIKLEEPSVRVKFKITTDAQGVTVKYYRTAVDDAAIFQSYEIIETVYKTKAQLEDEIEFDNTIDYDPLRCVFKIEIMPDFSHSDDIRAIEAQLEELMVNHQESDDGPSSDVLSPSDQILFDQLTAQLNHLKSIGCSGTQSEPCQKDELLCNLAKSLREDYEKCFLPLNIGNIYNYCSELDCFNKFLEKIKVFNTENPNYHLVKDHIAPLCVSYQSYLAQLEKWCKNGHDSTQPHRVLEYYNDFLACAIDIIEAIEELGNCNCGESSPCQKDKLLCDLAESLREEYDECFLPLTVDNIYDYCSQLSCFEEFLESIRNFDIDYPNYHLIKDHIQPLCETYKSLLTQLENWCQYEHDGSESEMVGEYYNNFVASALNIIEAIEDLGDCNCEGNSPCQKDEVICSLYDTLVSMYDDCFIMLTEDTIYDYCDESECFENFIKKIKNFNRDYPQYSLIDEHIATEFETYNSQLTQLISWCANHVKDHEAFGLYNLFLENTMKMITIIGKMGDCDCGATSPCQKDEILCAFAEDLTERYNDCFVTLTAENIYNYCDEMACFEHFYEAVKYFSKLHPEYELIEGHIHSQFSLLHDQLSRLIKSCKNPHSEDPAELQVNLDFYNSFLENSLEIITIIKEMGNCDCDCNCNDGDLSCITSFQEISWMTLEHYEYSETIPSQEAVEEDTNAMIAGINATAQPIWRPNTKYYIKFRLKDEVDNGQHPSGIFDYYYGFKTVGPVGHFHKFPDAYPIPETIIVDDVEIKQIAEEFPLTSLRKYIDYERSYPNADGNLILAKPLFYGALQCKIDIYFAKPFAYHMVNTWPSYNGLRKLEAAMHLAIKDPISGSIIPYPLQSDTVLDAYVPETILNGNNGWVSDQDPRIPHNIQVLNNYINNVTNNPNSIECTIHLGDAIRPAAYTYSVILGKLKPRKLYTALVYNAFDSQSNGTLQSEQVHEFVFQTSRYENFRQQVNSFMLKEYADDGVTVINQKDAVYEVALPLTPDQIDNAYALVTSDHTAQTLAIETQFYHAFDRVIEGVFGLKPLDPPTNTDFIKIVNSDSGDTIAVIIRNPEPFNNPKIPLDQILETLRFYPKKSNTPDPRYKVLFSKDYSQMIVMHESKKIVSSALYMVFKYKIWDGSNYVVTEDVDEDGEPISIIKTAALIK